MWSSGTPPEHFSALPLPTQPANGREQQLEPKKGMVTRDSQSSGDRAGIRPPEKPEANRG